MKTYFFTGRNPKNLSGVSWKIWRLEQKGRTVTVWWGPAKIVNRKITYKASLQIKEWKFLSEAQAKADAERRIAEKLRGGYERRPRQKVSNR